MNSTFRALLWLTLLAVWSGSALRAEDGQSQRPSPGAGELHKTIRELRRVSLQAPATQKADAELQDAIRKVRALVLPPKPGAPPRPRPTASAPAATAKAPAEAPEPAGPLTPELLAKIVKLPARDVANPAALADALFRAGQAKAALVFYGRALNAEQVPERRAWLIFQMGNCRQSYDPAGARQTYQRLLAEHPDSPWVPLAQARDVLAEWYQLNKPEAVLAEAKAEAAAKPTGPRSRAPAGALARQR